MSATPGWLETLAQVVGEALQAQEALGPLGIRYRQDGPWDVLIYPLPLEVVGGPADGEVIAPPFLLDADRLRSAFSRTDQVVWIAHGSGQADEEGPCLSVRGQFQGQEVWLRVLAYAPEDEQPGGKIDVNARRVA